MYKPQQDSGWKVEELQNAHSGSARRRCTAQEAAAPLRVHGCMRTASNLKTMKCAM